MTAQGLSEKDPSIFILHYISGIVLAYAVKYKLAESCTNLTT